MAATHVTDYQQLYSTILGDEKVVYLCGAGVSMSLGNHNLNWSNWILAGKDFLGIEDQKKFETKLGMCSANELINAATFLLQKLKSDGTYVSFMDKTIGSIHPVNEELMEAFRRIWRAGDLIASTNYDLQIEETVGADAVSYENPGDILSLICGKSENKVVHLHGLYDRLADRDDIVADGPQYQEILGNAGAQFIQNLIGTYPLIVVGCGGTVDDPNLSGFLTFVVEKLGRIDIPYFYLMKRGDTVPELPANAVLIYYGTEYSDLSTFLSELTALRLRKRLMLRGLVAVDPYQNRPVAISGFGRMHYSNGFSQFTGRETEFCSLTELLHAGDIFAWGTVLGEGGIGKSRLVLEWLKKLPAHWFGFFSHKNPDAASKFRPFTDTVIVFDYVLGEEDKCARTLEAFLEGFRLSSYKLRVLFLERTHRMDETDWLIRLKRKLGTGERLTFETSKRLELVVTELSVNDEIAFIKNYLQAYLSIIPQSWFVENCINDINGTSIKIEEAFRHSVAPDCYRPLYLGIFTEVWLSKEGKLSLDGVEELLNEYINKEKNRWKAVFNEDRLVDSYLRLLAVACAIGVFNITDMYGYNYLAGDCERLTKFLDEESEKPGADNVFKDIFVEMAKLEEGKGDDCLADIFLAPELFNDEVKDDTKSVIALLDEDEKFAYAASYIKLDADPVEVYLNMLVNAGMAIEEQTEELKRIREKRKKKDAVMPNHAWIICPVFPNIVKEYIVSYVVNDRDIELFTKLARSNSVLELEAFITRALDDWDSKEIFQRMAVIPPDEVLNYFEYYLGILLNVEKVQNLEAVEDALLESEPCFPRYEINLWRRIAIVLTDRGNVERLFDSAIKFTEYIKCRYELNSIRDELVDTMEAYSVGLHNAADVIKYSSFLQKCNEIGKLLPQNQTIGSFLCENEVRLVNLKLYQNKNADVGQEWKFIESLLRQYDFPKNMCIEAMGAARDFLSMLVLRENLEQIKEFEGEIERVYAKHPVVEIAEVAALCASNIYIISYQKSQKPLSEAYEKIKQCMTAFPDSMTVCSAYVATSNIVYSQTSSYRKVPDSLIAKAKEWSFKYPNEIEFQEGYFGLLMSRLEYAQSKNMKNEQRRVFREMVSVSQRADYSKYKEKNQLVEAVNMLRMLYGY